MVILGINVGEHTSSACMLKDGHIVGFCPEERLSRKKWDKAFPSRAVEYCLKEARISDVRDIDYAAINNRIFPLIKGRGGNFLYNLPHILLKKTIYIKDDEPRAAKFIRTLNAPYDLKRLLKYPRLKTFRIRHHLGHCAAAFFQSPFEKAAILSIDGAGEDDSGMMAIGEGTKIRRICSFPYPHSLGILYGSVTQFLGFKANSDEWKVMGLAAYGESSFYEKFKDIIKSDRRGSFRLNLKYFDYHLGSTTWFSEKFQEAFGEARRADEEINERHMDIAASVQKITEEIALSLLDYLSEKTRCPDLCLTGGVAMNSLMNGKIYYRSKFDNLFIPPVPDDAGLAVGSAFFLYHDVLKNRRVDLMKDSYWGPGFSEDEMEDELRRRNLIYRKSENIFSECARLLTDGNIIGWFQGRMEAGQRALGNRSILADPRAKDMKDIVNKKIKFRESFRPFAPSIIEEAVCEYFDCKHNPESSPFMSVCYTVKKDKRGTIPAVTHADGTARIQTVSKNTNFKFWALIKEFEKRTGVPVLLNTSFNVKDEPIVCSPFDAINTFLNSGLDYLVMEDYITSKNDCK